MSSAPAVSDVFWCPECGQKHRGDLHVAREGGSVKVRCVGCGVALAVTWADGKAVVKKDDAAAAAETPAPAAAPKAPAASPAAATPAPAAKRAPVPAVPVPPVTAASSAKRPVPAIPVPAIPVPPVAVAPGAKAPAAPAAKPPAAAAAPAAPAPAEPRGAPLPRADVTTAELPRSDLTGGGSAIPDALASGTQVGRYRIEEAIGTGGTGTVYRAYDALTNRYVALKLLNRDQSDTMRTRFLREIEVQANLRHAHLMPVFDRGEHAGRPYFTMELLYKPFTLTEIVTMGRDGSISRYATLRHLEKLEKLVEDVLVPVCEGMQVANVENGVVHRDLKPDNVLIDSRTLRAYVIDFGICSVLERRSTTSGVVIPPTGDDAGIVGTPRFLAPEQARGAVHERTDVWGLGAILYYSLTGEAPIAAASQITRLELRRRIDALREAETVARRGGDETRADLCAEKLARLEDEGLRTLDDLFADAREGRYLPIPSSVPAGLAAIAKKAMSPRTAERYASPKALASDIGQWLAGSSTRALSEQGTSAAAALRGVSSALRRHLVTGLLVVAAAAGAFFLGRALRGGAAGPSGDSAGTLSQLVEGFERRATEAGSAPRDLTPKAAARFQDLLSADLGAMRDAIATLPAGETRSSLEGRLAAIAARVAPGRVAFKLPDGEKARIEDVVRGGDALVVPTGEVPLKAGEYRIQAAGVTLPLVVPLVVREAGQSGDREPPRWTVAVPSLIGGVPEGMVLVVPGVTEVEHRGPPWSERVTFAAPVAPFLMDRYEVRNRDWLRFLESLSNLEERAKRTPPLHFAKDPERAGKFILLEDSRDLPVRGVSPEDMVAYCAWRSKEESATVRLPTEAEWVVAAGGLLPYDLANGARGSRDEGDFAEPVKVTGVRDTDRSPYGVVGLLGNVREVVTGIRTASGAVDAFMTKGAGPGDEPGEAAIRRVRPIAKDLKDPRVGFRCVREPK